MKSGVEFQHDLSQRDHNNSNADCIHFGYVWGPLGGSEELWSRAALLFLKRGHTVASSTKYWPIEPQQIAQLRRNGASVSLRRPIP